MLTFDDYLKTRPEREQRYIRRGIRYLNYLYAKQQAAQQQAPQQGQCRDSTQPATTPKPTHSRKPATPAKPHPHPIAK